MNSVNVFVFDTSTLISAAIRTNSVPAQAFQFALENGKLFASESTLAELSDVLRRNYLDRYLERTEREKFLLVYTQTVLMQTVEIEVTDCRDAKDNKFLELALSVRADTLISSDNDLLVLNPYHDIPILKPADFLAQQ